MAALDQHTREEAGPSAVGRQLSRSPARLRNDRSPPVALAILLVIHGLAHFVGVVAAFDAFEAQEPLGYLGGTWMVENELMIGLLGMLWAALGLGFVFAALAVVTEFGGWERSLTLLGTLSTALCVLALWSSWIGVVVNAVIVGVAVVSSNERFPGPPRLAV